MRRDEGRRRRFHQETGVQPISQALAGTPAQFAPSAYYAAKTRPASAGSLRDRELAETIKWLHEDPGVRPGRPWSFG